MGLSSKFLFHMWLSKPAVFRGAPLTAHPIACSQIVNSDGLCGALCTSGVAIKKVALARVLTGVVLFGLGLATGLAAQTQTDLPQRAGQKHADLSGAPGMEAIASIVELKPGESSDVHFHHGIETAYVIQGTLVHTPGEDPSVLPTGTTVLDLRDAQHGPNLAKVDTGGESRYKTTLCGRHV